MTAHRELFRTEQVPVLQNRMFSNAASAIDCTKGDVVLVQDLDTGLIFNAAFEPQLLDYDAEYQNEQAFSEVFRRHLDDVTAIIDKCFHGVPLLEVGCGKGYFLEHLLRSGHRVVGVDPAYEGTNPAVIKARFDASLGISAEGVLLRHVLEHIPDPVGFLAGIAAANGGAGAIYIEVPCFDWICRKRAWFDIFYEHVNYFRPDDFRQMFGTVHEMGHLFGGQYLYVVADLATLRPPRAGPGSEIKFPQDFLADLQRLLLEPRHGKRSAVWGSASKGVIFALYMKRHGLDIQYAIDINPAKQGKHLPATGLRVSSPQEAMQFLRPGDGIYVMNSNYLDEIIRQSANQYQYLRVDHHGL